MHELSSWKAPNHDDIRRHSSTRANRRIDQRTRDAIDEVGNSPSKIRARLDELDREWDIDRALMLNFAVLASVSSSMAMRTIYKHRRLGGWAGMFFAQMGFLAFHAIKRWCPPMPVFRRLGFRSDHEIAEERAALRTRLRQLEAADS
jgi:hypothetical protein